VLQVILRRARLGLRIPAVCALLIQASAFAAVILGSAILDWWADFQVSIALAALIQGLLAAALSYQLGMAIWWIWIQFLFPLALVFTLALHISSYLFLGAFVFLLALYWTIFRTRVPFYPSFPATWDAVAAMLPQDRAIRFADIGSGLGGLLIHLAKVRPESNFLGIELAPLPWIVSFFRAKTKSLPVQFERGDYCQLNFAHYDVVFAYLSPAAMPAVWEKAKKEMRPGSLLLSYEFPIVGNEPHLTSACDARGVFIYGWYM
jgi:hypothetical protein